MCSEDDADAPTLRPAATPGAVEGRAFTPSGRRHRRRPRTTLTRTLARKPAKGTARRSAGEFFDQLAQREYEPLLEKASGTARFEVVGGNQTERWLVQFDKGHIRVSRRNTRADTVVRAPKASFERAAAGHLNLMAAVLRGEIAVSGDPRMLVRLQRLFPRPGDRR